MTKKLPIGLDSFRDFSALGSLYVDKTRYIYQMMTSGGKTFFLNRPRRFGKSLLLSTIKAVFEGRKELFNGLYIEDKIDWTPSPVLTLDMSGLNTSSLEDMMAGLLPRLEDMATSQGLSIDLKDPVAFFSRLIYRLYEKTGKQLVVLVDEYDKPILDVIEKPELAAEIRQFLQSFYVVLKSSSGKIRFLMLTGVSKISQTSIFSGLNNLNDISFDRAYTGICGYTQSELEHDFSEYIEELAGHLKLKVPEVLAQIKYWYNGYSWDGETFVYNPFSVLLLLQKQEFKDYWFGTGTPAFLLKLLKDKDNLEEILEGPLLAPVSFSDGQALENLDTMALLFQTGYLTIKAYDRMRMLYDLQFPNEEVRKAISETVLLDLSGKGKIKVHELSRNIYEGFCTGNTALAIENLEILFSNTTYNTHQSNQNERHYQALFQLTMILAGIDHRGESQHSGGRTDAVLIFYKHIYVIEIKYAASEASYPAALAAAMEQIKTNQYHKPHLNQGKTIHLLALAFTKGGIAFEEKIV